MFAFTDDERAYLSEMRAISIGRPQGSKYDSFEVQTDNAKGFLIIHDDKLVRGKRKIVSTFSLYEYNSARCLGGMVISITDPVAGSENIVEPFISSIRFLAPENPDAAMIHYRQGTAYINGGQKL